MKCPNCNHNIPKDSAFCPFCGNRIPIGEVTAPFRLTFNVNSVAFNMIRVESGSFLMGQMKRTMQFLQHQLMKS